VDENGAGAVARVVLLPDQRLGQQRGGSRVVGRLGDFLVSH
jgi:hypothetical protein